MGEVRNNVDWLLGHLYKIVYEAATTKKGNRARKKGGQDNKGNRRIMGKGVRHHNVAPPWPTR